MNADTENTPKGIRWTYRDVLRGKFQTIMGIELVLVIVLLIVLFAFSKDATKLGTLVASMLGDLLSLKAKTFAMDLCSTIVYVIPVMVVAWFVIAGILTIVLNARGRNLARTPKNLEAHRVFTQRSWGWPWSLAVGVFDFSASFVVLNLVFSLLGGESLSSAAQNLWAIVFTTVCLVFAERRVKRVSRAMSGRLAGNRITVSDILDGTLDDYIPERYHNDLGRAKVATLVAKGVTASRIVAPLMVRGIDVRSKVLVFSGFLTATIHGVLTALTFGISNTAVVSLILVNGQFGTGRGKEYAQSLVEEDSVRPWFVVEACAVVICFIATMMTGFGYMA